MPDLRLLIDYLTSGEKASLYRYVEAVTGKSVSKWDT